MRKSLSLILLLVTLFFSGQPIAAHRLSEQSTISLLSCSPGYEFYFHFGHSAIRIQDPAFLFDGSNTPEPIDWTFNYGVFDFADEGFYLKFVKGETDYMLGLEPTDFFLSSSAEAGRTVYFQPLNIDLFNRQMILDALIENYRPSKRYYRYNFVYDNCATRPWNILRNTLSLPSPQQLSGVSWRHNIDHYSGRWTWGKFGINLAFGYEADREMTVEQALFLPENLMNYVSSLGITENEYIGEFVPRDGTFYSSPEFVLLLLALLLCALTIYDYRHEKQTWAVDLSLYVVYLILGLVLTFLYFFSIHPFVGSNLNVLYLNPLWLVIIILTCFDKGRHAMRIASPWLLGLIAVATGWMLFRGQTLHLMLAFVTLHMIRLYILHKNELRK